MDSAPKERQAVARKFKELSDALYAKMTPAARAAHEERVAQHLAQVRLSMMRSARELSEAAFAAQLGSDQGSIAKLVKDVAEHLELLRTYVEGLGGRLEMRVVFPEHVVTLEIGK